MTVRVSDTSTDAPVTCRVPSNICGGAAGVYSKCFSSGRVRVDDDFRKCLRKGLASETLLGIQTYRLLERSHIVLRHMLIRMIRQQAGS